MFSGRAVLRETPRVRSCKVLAGQDPGTGKLVLESQRKFSLLTIHQVATNSVWLFSLR